MCHNKFNTSKTIRYKADGLKERKVSPYKRTEKHKIRISDYI